MSPVLKGGLLVAVVVLIGGFAAYRWLETPERYPAASNEVERDTATAPSPPDAPKPVEQVAVGQQASVPMVLPAERTSTAESVVSLPSDAPTLQQAPVDAAQPMEPGLPAEAPLITARGTNARELGKLMMDGDYDEFLDRLTAQAAGDPLAVELTELYSSSAAEAAQQVPDVEVRRLACGRIFCAGVVRAVSADAFANWLVRYQANPAAKPHAMGMHGVANADGTIDYRFGFSNDPNRRAADHPRGTPVRIESRSN